MLDDDDDTPNLIGGSRPKQPPIDAGLWSRTDTGSWKAYRPPSQNRTYIAALILAACGAIGGWIGKAAWGGVTTAITADSAKAEDVKAIDKANAEDHRIIKADVSTIQADVATIKTEQQTGSKLLKRVARKLRVDAE